MSPEALQHPACPTRALAKEPMEALGHDGEAERDRLVLHQPTRPEHRPGEHDVLTDRIGPAADFAQVARPVGRKRPLRDERGVVRGLHALHSVDPEPVVPLLHARDEGLHRVLRDERGGARRYMLALRRARNANHEACERLLMQMGVSVNCHNERCRHRCKGRV